MKTIPTVLTLLALSMGPIDAFAKPNTGNGANANGFCPPGLANRNPPCVPPGQARQYAIGERINDDYIIISRPGDYGLSPNETYYRVGDYLYRVDRETREVLDLIGLVAAILN